MSRAPFAGQRMERRRPWPRWLDYALTIVILGLLMVVASRLDRVGERRDEGRPTVHDGDTLTVNAVRVRLRGMDAPEYTQSCVINGRGFPCGRRSREALAGLIAGKPVTCTGWERDKFDRLLATCSVGQPPLDLNREMVRQGWAVAYGDYRAEQESARNMKLGMWAGTFDSPSDWRRQHQRDHVPEEEHDMLPTVLNWLRQLFWR
ncbi:MAG TPA: thermonuclease family protein [Mesorhizobium sp.]